MSVFIVHAPNVHQGGGRTLLLDILQSLDAGARCKVILDARLELPAPLPRDVVQIRVRPAILDRLAAEWNLRRMAMPDDTVLCFGNLPPLFGVKARLFIFLQNRYLTGPADLSGFSPLKRLQILVERTWLKWCVRRVGRVIVQTPAMRREVQQRFGVEPLVMPFLRDPAGYRRRAEARAGAVRPERDFLYVASGDPHKNHRQLVEAWKLLAAEGIYPSLQLTVEETVHPQLVAWIEEQRELCGLRIDNRSLPPGQGIGELYGRAGALIYPSTLESLGLPLIEARLAGLPILAPELDYVRDVVDPEQTFDPGSAVSIARAVKRHLCAQEQPLPLVTPQAFVQGLMAGTGQP